LVQGAGVQGGIEWLDTGEIQYFNFGGNYSIVKTIGAFRDFSAWYHIVVTLDAANTSLKIYINGVEQALTISAAIVNEDHSINRAGEHNIGKEPTGSEYFSGYLADIHFIDGQALDPSSFTTTDLTTGQLLPVAYTGSYGTNGFKLNFSSNATTAALGTDTSGNSNTWTVNNFSVTAGVNNDSLIDTPTSYGTDTGVGGEVRGNYCTWNPLDNGGIDLSNGNLDVSNGAAHEAVRTTIKLPPTGKWYAECKLNSFTSGTNVFGFGIDFSGASTPSSWSSTGHIYIAVNSTRLVIHLNNTEPLDITTDTSNAVLQVAYDSDAQKLWLGFNNVWRDGSYGTTGNPSAGTNPTSTSITGGFLVGNFYNSIGSLNTGQRAFAYTAPSGFKALVDTNLPAPVVAKPDQVMGIALRSGFGSSGGSVSSLKFSPDLIWEKPRNVSNGHVLVNTVAGISNYLSSNVTSAELTDANYITGITSTGYTIGSSDFATSNTLVSWCWDAGTSTVTNTAGSITSQVRANPSAGFSVVTWTRASTADSIGHGLGVAPRFIICKSRSNNIGWMIGHAGLDPTSPWNYRIFFDTGARNPDGDTSWNGVPTSSVFYTGNTGYIAGNMVAYCFAPVSGYSSAFSYTGNGDSSGPFVYLGFRPRFIIQKRTDSAGSWLMIDTARDPVNVARNEMFANSSAAEYDNGSLVDVLSNGFKIRATFANMNASGGSFIGYAFAENPFQYARAR
jgi:hypothetical protein